MRYLLMLVGLAAVVAICLTAPLLADSFTSFSSYPGDRTQVKVTVSLAALEKSPSWDENADNPPLPAKKALKLAGAMKDTLVKDNADIEWALYSTSLMPMGEGKWIWLVTYWVRSRGSVQIEGPPPNLRLAVLMDGTVVKPEVRRGRSEPK